MAGRRTSPRAGCAAIAGLLLAACGGSDTTETSGVSGVVVVFAAASLTEAFTEVGEAFTAAHPDVTVTFNFAASSELAAQIVEGAPADVFASADFDTMTRVTDADAAAGTPAVFARNRSAIIVEAGNPLGIDGVADLADDDVILVTCAPQVPCGTYASRIFANAGIAPTPDSYEENVKAVVTKVAIGEADAGIVYVTDLRSTEGRADGVEIPTELDVAAEYPIVLTAEASNPEAGRAFVDFVLDDAGRRVLADHGFSAP